MTSLIMRLFCSTVLIFMLISQIISPPVTPNHHDKKKEKEPPKADVDDPLVKLEYHRYLREVVTLLEGDDEFKRRIENASVEDIKSGKIASHLELVNHQIRTQLDELKRKEIERLSELLTRRIKLHNLNGKDIEHILPRHIDHENVNTFEKSDLEKLIKEASNQLEEIDKQKRAEFKEHELEKEYEYRKKLEAMDEEHRKKAEKEHQEELEKRKHHERVNHPGSQDQLEEVWEKQDHLEDVKFDPKTFFSMHDMNNDKFLDQDEIEALFENELRKIYNESDPSFDPIERDEERRRMREHVFTEIDKDKDSMVSLDEFINATKTKDFDENPEWKSVEDERQFDSKEFEEYAKTHDAAGLPHITETAHHQENTTPQQHHDNTSKQAAHP